MMSSDLKKITRIFSIIIIFIALVGINVYAQEFSITRGENPGSICPGATALINDVVRNDNTNDLEFTITSIGSSSGFVTSVPPGFILKPGQSKTIYTYISPRTSTEPGRYSLDINVQAGSESERITRSIDVSDCRSFSLNSITTQKSLCPTDVEKYDFELVNSGESTETFDLRLEGQIASWATLSEESVTLARKESKMIYVYVTSPSDSLGEYQFSLSATSRSNKKVQVTTASLDVNACFDYTITTTKDFVSICENTREIIPVEIENSGTVSNDYSLELDAPEWASLENNRINIPSGSTRTVNIVVNPGYSVEGDFNLDFRTRTDKGSIESSNQFNVNVKKCNDVSIQIEKSQDKICNSLSNTYNVNIRNTGEFTKDFKLELIGPVWTSLSDSQVTLAPEEEEQLLLTINPGFDVAAGDYDIVTRITALDSSKVNAESKLTLTTIAKEDCYKPVIGLNEKEVEVYYDSSATIPVVIENKGNQEATYDIGVSGTASSFIDLNPAVVTIAPNQAEIVYIYAAPNSETRDGDYFATISVRLKDSTILASDSIKISVSQSTVPIEVTDVKSPQTQKTLWQRIVEFFTGKPKPPQVNNTLTNIPLANETQDNEITEINQTTTEEQETQEPTVNQTVVEEQPETNQTTTNETIATESQSDLDFSQSSKQLALQNPSEVVTFKIGTEDHSSEVTSIDSGVVKVLIKSDPIEAEFSVIGETKTFDLNNDGTNDLKVTYMGIKDGRAQLIYENLVDKPTEVVTEDNTNIESEDQTDTTSDQQTNTETTSTGSGFNLGIYWKYIVSGIIILILIILIVKYRKSIKEFFEEEIEEEPATIKKEPAKEATVHKEATKEEKKEATAHKENSKEEKKEHKKEEPHKKEMAKEVKKEEKKTPSKPKSKKEQIAEEYY